MRGNPEAKVLKAGESSPVGVAEREWVTELQTLIEYIPISICTLDIEGNITYVNKGFEEIFGHSRDEVLGKNWFKLGILPDQNLKRLSKRMEASPKGRPRHKLEVQLKRKEGEPIWVEMEARLIKKLGRPVGFRLVSRDIAERKRAEEALRELNEKYQQIIDNTWDTIFHIDLEGKFTFGNKAAERLTGYPVDRLLRMNMRELIAPEYQSFVFRRLKERIAGQPLPQPFDFEIVHKDAHRVVVELTTTGIHDKDGRLMGVQGIARDVTERKKVEQSLQESEEKLRAQYKSIPVPTYTWRSIGEDLVLLDYNDAAVAITRGKIANFIGKKAREMYQDMPEIQEELWRCLTEKTIIEREMAYHYMSTGETKYLAVSYVFVPPDLVLVHTEDITKRKQAEESLKESEERYRTLFENSIEGVFAVDLGGHLTSVNKAIEELLGYSEEELMGMSYKRIVPAEDVEFVFEEYNKLFRTGKPIRNLVYEMIRKDGERRLIEGYVNVINTEGTIVGFQGTLRDITERKKAEDALRSERDKLAALMDGLARTEIGIDIVGVDYKVLFQNRTLKERFGDLTAELCYEKYMGRQEPCDLCPMVKAIESNNVESVELTGADGRDYQLFSAPLPNPDGTVDKVIETVVDITERKKADKALKASEEQYRALVENANEAIIVAQDGMLKFTNPKAAEFTGYSKEELTSKPFLEFIHPDDRDMVVERHLRRLKGEELPHMYPFRIVDKEGDIKWVEINAVLIEWEGRPATLDFLSEITDRKRAEEQLERSFVDLAETVSRAIGSRDPYTAAHQRRVAELARLVAQKMRLDKERLQGLYIGGLLHDIGKISVPETILSKSGKLTDEEWSLIRVHTKRGHEILQDTKLPRPVADMALHHHERLDGSGYPCGISGDQLSLEVRILAVCDVVEAMSSHRPYRPARSREEVLQEIKGGRGTRYDADVVDIMLQIIQSGELDSLLSRPE